MSHAMFGLLLQLFLLEAFGRELQDETLEILAIGAPAKPERIEIYFRADAKQDPYLLLGELEEVLRFLANRLGIYTVPPPICAGLPQPWTRATQVLVDGNFVVHYGGEYVISEPVFDLCHSHKFMARVLRGGTALRDRLHAGLRKLYDNRRKPELASEAVS